MGAGNDSPDRFRTALKVAQQGDLRPAQALLAASPMDDNAAFALRSVCALAGVPGVRAPTPDQVHRGAGGGPAAREAARHACACQALAAFLAFDRRGARHWSELQAALVDGERAQLAYEISRGWSDLLHGEVLAMDGRVGDLERAAARTDETTLVLEAAIQGALAKAGLGDIEGATRIARRAARMTRTESLLFQEYTANLALARIRRLAGLPHLSTRILASLMPVMPAAWQPWASWEIVFAGGRAPRASPDRFGGVWSAGRDGDRSRFDALRANLLHGVAGWQGLQIEAQIWFAALDPAAPYEFDPELNAWCRGERKDLPYSLRAGASQAGSTAFVVCPHAGFARRVLNPGVGLAASLRADEHVEGAEASARIRAMIAALCLAPHGRVREDQLFREVYGFDFVPSKHDGVLRTLLHRVRAELGSRATVTRQGGEFVFEASVPIVVSDPRCDLPLQERILQIVARGREGVTAKAVAEALKVPAKRVHEEMRRLIEEGACHTERDGRRVFYRVEDTTFYEPSLHRLGRLPGRDAPPGSG